MTSDAAWPAFDDDLAARLSLDDEGFAAMLRQTVDAAGVRLYGPQQLEHALGYPWPRPAASFVLNEDGTVATWDDAVTANRHALLAIGSNASPERLGGKVADLEDRTVGVQAHTLRGYDVGASPNPTNYGALPATLFASPGTEVDLAVLWVTDAQLAALTWSEVNYRLARVDGLLAYVSRWGAFAPGGEPVALHAVPARNRTARAYTQGELLDAAAAILGLPDGAAIVRAVHEDWPGLHARLPALHRHAHHDAWVTWTPAPRSPGAPGTAR